MFIGNEGYMGGMAANHLGMFVGLAVIAILLFGAGFIAGYFVWRRR